MWRYIVCKVFLFPGLAVLLLQSSARIFLLNRSQKVTQEGHAGFAQISSCQTRNAVVIHSISTAKQNALKICLLVVSSYRTFCGTLTLTCFVLFRVTMLKYQQGSYLRKINKGRFAYVELFVDYRLIFTRKRTELEIIYLFLLTNALAFEGQRYFFFKKDTKKVRSSSAFIPFQNLLFF